MDKKISVIIPCYQCSNVIHHAIRSLLDQTIGLDSLEIILVNDASLDDSLDCLLEYQRKIPETVRVIDNKTNSGQSICRNIGIDSATGDYITFLDQDDWIVPEMYEEMYRKAKRYDCDMVSAFHKEVFNYDNLPEMGRREPEHKDGLYYIAEEAERRTLLLSGLTVLGGVCVWEKIYKRSFILENRIQFPDKKLLYEDYYFLELCLLYVRRFYIMQCDYHYYFIHLDATFLHKDRAYHLHKLEVCMLLLQEYNHRGFIEKYSYEMEAKFLVNYYIDGFHSIFTRFTEPPINKIYEMKRNMLKLYPEIQRNPYIADENIRENILGIRGDREIFYNTLYQELSDSLLFDMAKNYWDKVQDSYRRM